MKTTTEFQAMFVANREVREIPKGWRHPTDARGRHIPLLPYGYSFDGNEDRSPTMPAPLGDTEIMAYETTSEGTPISPAFPNSPDGRLDLINYCTKHATTFGERRADGEAWAAILFGSACVAEDGTVQA